MQWVHRLEPVWWSLFAAGGTVAAFLVPVHIFINHIAVPLGWISRDATSYETMARMVENPLVKTYLVALLALTAFNALHRITFLPGEFLVPPSRRILAPVSYAMGVLLTVVIIVVVAIAP